MAEDTCEVEGCIGTGRITRGMCSKHYQRWRATGTTDLISGRVERPCAVDDCDRPFRTRDLCAMHYARLINYGSTEDPRNRPKPTCAAEEPCNKTATAGGLCGTHYARRRKHGTTAALPKKPIRTESPCSVEGCTDRVRSKGLCNAHYQQWRKPPKPEPVPCAVEGCPDPASQRSTRGLCSTHQRRWNQTGSTDKPVRKRAECTVDGCTEPNHCRDFCKRHYERWRRSGDPLAAKREVRRPRLPEALVGVTEKTCSRCKEVRALVEFNKRTGTPDGLSYHCKYCAARMPSATKQRERYQNDPEFRRRTAERLKAIEAGKGPEWKRQRNRESKLWHNYRMTLTEFDAMSEAQGHVCLICKRPPYGGRPDARKQYLSVDHDHVTGKIRGLLCDGCNISIGHFSDDPERLRAALAYLLMHAPEADAA